jgi:hypothetical protein
MESSPHDAVSSEPATEGDVVCVDCGDELAACLARLGSLRCHGCREERHFAGL